MDVAKPQPYTFDLGTLLCTDPNPLPAGSTDPTTREATLQTTARDCAQALINQLLTTCPISRAADDGSLQLQLPAPETLLPREKPVPKEKEKTKWERFAEKKGIKGKKREGKMEFDEAKGDWVPKYGYKGKKTDEGDWLVEVDDKPAKVEMKGRGMDEARGARAAAERRGRTAKGGIKKKGAKGR